jgi:YfiH family protein
LEKIMEFQHLKTETGLDLLQAEGLTDENAVHCFTTRKGGVSTGHLASLNLGPSRGDDPGSVRENYRRVCAALGTRPEALVLSHQVHRDNIRICTSADAGKGYCAVRDYDADGLATDVPGLTLTIFGADCIPILFYDPVRRVVAACHGGWRGTALDIAGKTVRKMSDVYGTNPADLRCAIGPGICAKCFETDPDVPEALEAALGDLVLPCITPLPEKRFQVDLKGIHRCCLEKAGVLAEKIVISDDCTACRPDIYWSHRKAGERRGVQCGLIALRD